EQHLAEALGLRLGTAAELQVIELGDAVDDLGDLRPKAFRYLVFRGRRVLDDVMDDRRDDRRRVQAQVGKDLRYRYRMRDVRLAAQALLALMGRGTEFICLPHTVHLRGRQIGFELIEELVDADRAPSGGKPAPNG